MDGVEWQATTTCRVGTKNQWYISTISW